MARSLNASTQILIDISVQRGIDVIRFLDIDVSVALLEYQGHRELIYFSRTDHHGSVTLKILENKGMTTALLRRGGFPVPEEILTADLAAAEKFLAQHRQCVVKPLGNTGGIGITTGITTRQELARAFARAVASSLIKEEPQRAIVQQHAAGDDCRVLVVGQQHLFAIQRLPASVTGDGEHTISELVAAWNVKRKEECRIQLNEAAHELLAKLQLTVASVPELQQRVQLAYVSNYHAGGRLRDATDELGDEIRSQALAIARYFDIPVVGIDFMSPDIRRTAGVVIELNGTPDLTIHHVPDEGSARDAGGAVIDMLFPETA